MLVTIIKIKARLTDQNINLLRSYMKITKVDGSSFVTSYQFYWVIQDIFNWVECATVYKAKGVPDHGGGWRWYLNISELINDLGTKKN